MSPIVLFVISFNLLLSVLGIWLAWQIWQYRQCLIQLHQSIRAIYQILDSNLPLAWVSSGVTTLQLQYQQLNQSLPFKTIFILQLLSQLYQLQQVWRMMPFGKSRKRLR